METLGTHILADYSDCDPTILDDVGAIEELLNKAAEAAGATTIVCKSHRLHPDGLASIAILQESHISIRSSPDARFVAADLFTCGDCNPDYAHTVLAEGLRAGSFDVVEIERGMLTMPMMRVRGHRPTQQITVDCSHKQLPPSVMVKQSPGRGLGLFSRKSLEPGDFIYETDVQLASFDTEYLLKTDAGDSVLIADDFGTELTVPVLLELPENVQSDLARHYGISECSPVQLRDAVTDGGRKEVLVTSFDGLVNHSQNANIRIEWPQGCLSFENKQPVWKIRIVASRSIMPGEELFWDYSEIPGFIVPSDWHP